MDEDKKKRNVIQLMLGFVRRPTEIMSVHMLPRRRTFLLCRLFRLSCFLQHSSAIHH